MRSSTPAGSVEKSVWESENSEAASSQDGSPSHRRFSGPSRLFSPGTQWEWSGWERRHRSETGEIHLEGARKAFCWSWGRKEVVPPGLKQFNYSFSCQFFQQLAKITGKRSAEPESEKKEEKKSFLQVLLYSFPYFFIFFVSAVS